MSVRRSGTSLRWLLVACLVLSIGRLAVGDPPAPPKLSTVIPADALVAQAKQYLEQFDAWTASETDYNDNVTRITRDANTLMAVALVLGKHDTDTPLKPAAAAIVKAAGELAAAKDYASTKAGVAAVKAAAAGGASGSGEPEWEKTGSLGQLMKQVTFLNTRLLRTMRRFQPQQAEQAARDAAILAVIGQVAAYDTHEVKNPQDLEKWYKFTSAMRDIGGELSAKLKAGDQGAAKDAMGRMTKNCEACHAVFRKDIAVQ